MFNFYKTFLILFSIFFMNSVSYADKIEQVIVNGNDRVSRDTIILFSNINNYETSSTIDTNEILKNLYDTNFFENVSVKYSNQILEINVKEAAVIERIKYNGIKAQKFKDAITKDIKLKSRSSYNQIKLIEDKENIESKLRQLGYYFSTVEVSVEKIDNNKVNVIYEINLGDKAKIEKISFIGDKIFKDGKLKSLITSEEYKFWKFISGRKFLKEDNIQLDKRLLKNFYLNQGYKNVVINASFAKLITNNKFELIFNINAGKKIYFNDLELNLPNDFNPDNFLNLKKLFVKLKGKPYSIYSVNQIIDQIDLITVNEEYKNVNATAEEITIDNVLNIKFVLEETDNLFVERINILGNNVTKENVIRNQLAVDEGDPYNKLLELKSVNNLKSLNFFKDVRSEVIVGSSPEQRIINYTVQEKPTGEIAAGAGLGSSGGSLGFSVKENNYLGEGLGVEASTLVTDETFKGKFSINNPNFNDTDKSIFFNLQAIETDRLKNYGYKTNKNGFEIGTTFEYLDNFNLGLSTSSFYEKIETGSKASARQKKQQGDYWDTFLKTTFDYDKRNQKFKTTSGFRSFYSLDLPVISDNNTLTNTYNYKHFKELYENNVTSFSLFLQSANSLTGEDVKLSERLTIPSSRLRGFEVGRVGPKDGNDFVGGNYITAINVNTTVPQVFENIQNLDAILFLDAANIWGVDYDSSLNDSSGIRSSIGIGLDYFSVIGPINVSLSEVISKENTDKTETFRFNIGTTF